MWIVIEPFLFGLIGTLVDLSQLDPNFLLNGIYILCISLVLRAIGSYVSVMSTEMGHNERMFMMVAGVPKATVQAALSSELFELASALDMKQEMEWGKQVITLIIFFILITAPVGAILISVLGPSLLPVGEA